MRQGTGRPAPSGLGTVVVIAAACAGVGRISHGEFVATTQPESPILMTSPVDGAAGDGDLTPQQLQIYLQMIQRHPEVAESLIEMYPQLREAAAPVAEPAPPDAAQLLDEAQRRDLAAALVGQLLTAEESELDALEVELAGLGDAARIELELAALDSDYNARRRAESMSGRIRWRQAAGPQLLASHDKLIATMATGTPGERAALVDKVADSNEAAAVGFLRECVSDAQPYVRQRAIDGMVTLGTEQRQLRREIAALFESILKTGNQDAQLLMIGALSKLQHARPAVLAPLLSSPTEEIRRTALLAMGHSRDRSAVPHILPMLRDEQWQVRAAALDALDSLLDSRSDDADVGEAIMLALGDPDPFVSAGALRLLGKMNFAAGAERLEQMLERGEGSERSLLEALARMKRPAGRERILTRYRGAATAAERVEWLGLLEFYDDGATDDVLIEVLKDPQRREEWPTVLGMWRRDPQDRFRSLLAQKLLDGDQAIVDAAWQRLRSSVSSKPLPADVLKALASHADPHRRALGLRAVYLQRDSGLEAHLQTALGDPADDVVSMALGILAMERFGDALGADVGQASYVSEVYDPFDESAAPATQPASVAELDDVLRRLRDGRRGIVGLRAAAILYRAGLADDEATRKALADGLESDDNATQLAALSGIADRPAPFLEQLNLEHLLGQGHTRPTALHIMSTTGRPEHLKRLIGIAEQATLQDVPLVAALIRSNDPEARTQALRLWQDDESYNHSAVLRTLKGPTGEGTVAFIREVLRGDDIPWDLPQFILRQRDASAVPMLEALLMARGQGAYYAGQAVRRLQQLDAAAATRAVTAMVQNEWIDGNAAAEAMLQVKPDAAMARAVLDRARRDGFRSQWRRIATWLAKEHVLEVFLPAMSDLPPEAVEAIAWRVAKESGAEGVEKLLAADLPDAAARERLAGIIGYLTAGDAAVRPDLAGLSPLGLAVALSAAGEWQDAVAVVEPYLSHADVITREAAARGLALHVATARPTELGEPQRTALVDGTKSGDAGLAYLSVEALAAVPEGLAGLDASEVKGLSARLRLIMAGFDLPDREKLLAAARTGQKGLTAQRFAIAVGLEARVGPALPMALVWPHRDVLLPWALEARDLRALEPAVTAGLLKRGDAGFERAAELLVTLSRKRNDPNLTAALATAGAIGEPAQEDFNLLIKFLVGAGIEPGEYSVERSMAERIARRWAREHPAWVDALANGRPGPTQHVAVGLQAEALGSKEAAGRLPQLILAAAGNQSDGPQARVMFGLDTSVDSVAQMVEVLRRLGATDDIKPLAEAFARTSADDYRFSALRLALVRAIAERDPAAVAALAAGQAELMREISLLAADDAAVFDTLAAVDPSELTELVRQARAGSADAAALAKLLPPWPPMPDESYDDWDDEIAYVSAGIDVVAAEVMESAVERADGEPHAPVERLRTMLADEKLEVRLLAIGSSGAGMHMELADAIAARLAEADDDAERIAAAAALATLRGRAALPTLAAAMEAGASWPVRVELAALLEMLDDDRGGAVLDDAERIMVARRLRMRAQSIDQLLMAGDGAGYMHWSAMTEAGMPPDAAGAFWGGSFLLVRGEQVAQRERAVQLAPSHAALHDLTEMNTGTSYVDDPAGARDAAADLPIDPLVAIWPARTWTDRFVAEQALEPRYFVQFAQDVDAQAELPQRWEAWWEANREQGADAWWRQAVEQALRQMEHGRWWQRTMGWRRYQRLTGARLEVPSLFDREAWKSLSGQLAEQGVARLDPRQAVIDAGIEAGVVKQEIAGDPLAALVWIAGWAEGDLSVAARLQLAHWPDDEALLAAALQWQSAPAADLREWVRERMRERTGRVRLFHDASALAAPAVGQ